MAQGMDQPVGYGMMSLAGVIFAYYTVWVIVLPFVDEDHVIHQYFLPRLYALTLPIVAGFVAVAGLGIFIAFVMVGAKKKSKTS